MSDSESILQKAEQHYDVAHYLLNVTLPAIKDPKLMLGIVENIFNSLENLMKAALYHSGKTCPESFEAKLALFNERFSDISSKKIFDSILEINEMRELHKNTSMEFRRGESFVLCHPNYRLKPLTSNDLQKHLDYNKKILSLIKERISSEGKTR